jgi:acetyl-CoA C-acetyltransferase
VIAGYARTPFGKFGGALRDLALPEFGAIAVRAALAHAGVSPTDVDEVAIGVNFPGQERSVARQILLRSGIPEERVAYTVDRACCSSLSATSLAARSLALREADVAVSGGAENLSKVPYFLPDMRWGARLGNVSLTDQLVVACPHTGVPRAVQAGVEALSYGVGREEQDAWAFRSQQRHAEAQARNLFADEIVAVATTDGRGAPIVLERDEPPRPETTIERLATLPTVYGSSTVTAGTAPDLSSGATALVLVAESAPIALQIEPLATIESWALASGDPQKLASMPARAASLALERAGLELRDLELIEINEAFAAVPLVTTLVLADGDAGLLEWLRERTNVNGGAIAIGHPTGATGARLIMTAVSELRRRGGGKGLITICGGIGEAESIVVDVPPR